MPTEKPFWGKTVIARLMAFFFVCLKCLNTLCTSKLPSRGVAQYVFMI